MIRMMLRGLCPLAISLTVCCHAQCGQLPLMPVNPGFEDGTNGWRLPEKLWCVTDGAGRGRSKALVWENSDPKRYLFPRQTIKLEPGGIYRYGAYVKVNSMGGSDANMPSPKVSLELSSSSGEWIDADYATPTGDPDADGWLRYEGVAGPIPACVSVGSILGFLPRGSVGRVLFDDFYFSRQETRRVDVVVSSAYRDTAEGEKVTFVASLLFDPTNNVADSFTPVFVFRNAVGKEQEVVPDAFDALHAAVSLDVSNLAVGPHPVTFVLRSKADGQEIDRASCLFTRAAVRRRVSFDSFGRTLVDGRPFFPLGMYARDVTPGVLALYTNGTPYNCIMPYHAPSGKMLDSCWAAGLMVVYSVKDLVYGCRPGMASFRTEEESRAYIAKLVNAAKDHPAVLAWYTNDESLPRQSGIQRRLGAMLHSIDADHPVWHVTDKAYKIKPFLGAFDVVGMDPYPIGLSGGMGDIGRISQAVHAARRETFGTVPTWHVAQAFNWAWDKKRTSDLHRFPTEDELVSMTWQSIAAGANGLIYYAFHRICLGAKPDERAEFLRRVTVAAAEVKERIPLILSDPGPEAESVPHGALCRTWMSAPGRVTLLAANSTRNPVSGVVTFCGMPPQSIELPPLGHVFIEVANKKEKHK